MQGLAFRGKNCLRLLTFVRGMKLKLVKAGSLERDSIVFEQIY